MERDSGVHGSAKPTGPDDTMRAAWRAACLAYRRTRQSGKLDPPAYLAAVTAFLEVIPEMPRSEASSQVQQAIYWASAEHPEWFWRGVRGPQSPAEWPDALS